MADENCACCSLEEYDQDCRFAASGTGISVPPSGLQGFYALPGHHAHGRRADAASGSHPGGRSGNHARSQAPIYLCTARIEGPDELMPILDG